PPHPYPLSLHDALPISGRAVPSTINASIACRLNATFPIRHKPRDHPGPFSLIDQHRIIFDSATNAFLLHPSPLPWVRSMNGTPRSEEHTSELQSRFDLV